MTPQRLASAEQFCIELNHIAHRIELINNERNRTAAASFGIAADHHHAIFLLLKNTFYSSSFALLRCLFEAYFRGLWLRHCATDIEIDQHFKGREPPKLIKMIADIETKPIFSDGTLSRIKKSHWNAMCTFTHTGGLHLQRWQTSEAIEPNFNSTELEECLNKAEMFGAMATFELVQMSKSGDDGSSVLELMDKRWPQ